MNKAIDGSVVSYNCQILPLNLVGDWRNRKLGAVGLVEETVSGDS